MRHQLFLKNLWFIEKQSFTVMVIMFKVIQFMASELLAMHCITAAGSHM
jgi:hypothetical protein